MFALFIKIRSHKRGGAESAHTENGVKPELNPTTVNTFCLLLILGLGNPLLPIYVIGVTGIGVKELAD